MDPEDASQDMLNGNHFLRHANGTSAVPADQFGKQTYIKQGKGYGGFKEISTQGLQAESLKCYNIVNEHCTSPEINVHNAVDIGKRPYEYFSVNLPNEINKTIEKRLETMQCITNSATIQNKAVYDLEAICA